MRALNGHMIYYENVDGRVCIVFPYLGRILLGSTDIRVDRPGDVRCEVEEAAYILKSLSYVFPAIPVTPEQIVYRYSGVRPLPRSNASFTGRISRDHFVDEIPGSPPTLCLVGGKWTTFRAFGAQAADRALAVLGRPRNVSTDEMPIGGGAGFPFDEAGQRALAAALAAELDVSWGRAAHATARYGIYAGEVLAFNRDRQDRPIAGTGYTDAELRYLIRHEHARSHADLLQRRTSLAITGAMSDAVVVATTAILADELGWSPDKAAAEEHAFRALLARDHGLTDGILAERDRNTTRSLECA
jgi:glycerol-3-phosphate dehydrogenase